MKWFVSISIVWLGLSAGAIAPAQEQDEPAEASIGAPIETVAETVADAVARGQQMLIVVGAGGTPEYAKAFQEAAGQWEQAAKRSQTQTTIIIGLDSDQKDDSQLLAAALREKLTADGDTLWIVLIGHGTFDGKLAKFNLRGPDVTATQLATYLERFRRQTVIVNGGASSAPFINRLSGPNRVIVTATDSGYELNYARFGIYLAEVIAASEVDLDKDEQTSILEAFLAASKKTVAFYEDDGRLVTEHALIDDNGDGRGTPATFYRGVRVAKPPKEGQPDGFRANQIQLIRSPRELALTADQRSRRDAFENEIEVLRAKKSTMSDETYFKELEQLFLGIAAVYDEDAETNE